MVFCPPDVVWGNVADWAAVAVAAVVGFLVWRLTAAANRIATEQHHARVASERSEISHIAFQVFRELKPAASSLAAAQELLEKPGSLAVYCRSAEFRTVIHSFVTSIRRSDISENPAALSKLPGNAGKIAMIAWAWIDELLKIVAEVNGDASPTRMADCFENFRVVLPKAVRDANAAVDEVLTLISN